MRGVARAQLYHLVPRCAAVARLEEVDRARGRAAVVVVLRPDGDEVASYRHGGAEAVVCRGVPRGDLADLGPREAVVRRAEDVHRALPGVAGAGVLGARHEQGAVHGHGHAEVVARGRPRRGDLRDLGPRGAAVSRHKHVDGARFHVLLVRAGDDEVAGRRHGPAQAVGRGGVARGEARGLRPRGAAVGRPEDVDRARALYRLAKVCLPGGADDDDVKLAETATLAPNPAPAWGAPAASLATWDHEAPPSAVRKR